MWTELEQYTEHDVLMVDNDCLNILEILLL